jgi:Ser/Thr protein kinase RdoA (MazF antagonist)
VPAAVRSIRPAPGEPGRHRPGLARPAGGDVFVKRHDPRVRSAAQLAAEHAFIAHLRARGFPAPAVRRTPDGHSAMRSGGFVYEVHDRAAGIDLYRDAVVTAPDPVAAIGRMIRQRPGLAAA